MPEGLHAVNVGTRLVLSGPDRRRGGLQLTRPEHPWVCSSQAAGPDPVRSVDGRAGWPQAISGTDRGATGEAR
jgi:hypothetical protein